eukprot:2093797-Prymnesium_polylepis.1
MQLGMRRQPAQARSRSRPLGAVHLLRRLHLLGRRHVAARALHARQQRAMRLLCARHALRGDDVLVGGGSGSEGWHVRRLQQVHARVDHQLLLGGDAFGRDAAAPARSHTEAARQSIRLGVLQTAAVWFEFAANARVVNAAGDKALADTGRARRVAAGRQGAGARRRRRRRGRAGRRAGLGPSSGGYLLRRVQS